MRAVPFIRPRANYPPRQPARCVGMLVCATVQLLVVTHNGLANCVPFIDVYAPPTRGGAVGKSCMSAEAVSSGYMVC
jgi:hypothetical protein